MHTHLRSTSLTAMLVCLIASGMVACGQEEVDQASSRTQVAAEPPPAGSPSPEPRENLPEPRDDLPEPSAQSSASPNDRFNLKQVELDCESGFASLAKIDHNPRSDSKDTPQQIVNRLLASKDFYIEKRGSDPLERRFEYDTAEAAAAERGRVDLRSGGKLSAALRIERKANGGWLLASYKKCSQTGRSAVDTQG